MTLTVVMVDRWCTYISVVHEQQVMPYAKRTVQIELTPEQVAALTPRVIGNDRGKEKREEIMECWIEPKAPA